MNKILQIILLIVFISLNVNAQSWNWVNTIGTPGSDKVINVRSDASSNVIVSGYFSEDVNLGNGVILTRTTSGGTSKEAFVAKYDSNGVCQWAKSAGGWFDDRVLGMDIDNDGNVYITGTCWFSIQMGPFYVNDPTGSSCCDQTFVAKLDKNGNWIWTNMAGGMGDDQGLDIVTDATGNSYIAGFMADDVGMVLNGSGTATFISPTNIGTHIYNYWVAKIDSSGVWQWGRSFGNLPWDPMVFKYVERDNAIAMDGEGNLYIAGGFDGTQQFGDDTLTSNGGTDIFLMSYDTSGNFRWAISGGSEKDDWCNGVAADSMGHVYITGEHRDSFNFGSVYIKNYDKRDVFIAKFDASNGSCIWGKRAGSKVGSERGNDVFANRHCKVYVVGDIGEKSNFGGDIETDSTGSINSFLARISVDGDWMWAVTGGSSESNDRCNAVAVAPNQAIYVGGNFKLPATYGLINVPNAGKTDGFFSAVRDVSQLDTCGEVSPNSIFNNFNDALVKVYPNPASDFIYIETIEDINSTLVDINGKIIFATKEKTIDISKLTKGMYILRIENKSKEFTQKKIVIN
jgi:hypothetical protein